MSGGHREIAKLARRARALGFEIQTLRRHQRWVSPDGESITISSTPGSGTTEAALLRLLRRYAGARDRHERKEA